MASRTYAVTSLTWSHCVSSVTEEAGQLSGVHGVLVGSVPGGRSLVTIDRDRVLALDDLRPAVGEAGYELARAAA